MTGPSDGFQAPNDKYNRKLAKRTQNKDNKNFFQALLEGVKEVAMQIHTVCFITNSTIRDSRNEIEPTVHESGKGITKIPKSSAFKTIVKKSSASKTPKDKDASAKKDKTSTR